VGWRESITKVLAGKVGGPWEGGIRAYHSSPHDFDKVDFSKLRTGEGANMYGAGHYMAENPAVSGQGGQYWNQFLSRFPEAERDAAKSLQINKFDREQAAANLRSEMADTRQRAAQKNEYWERPEYRDAHYANILRRQQEELDALLRGGPVGPRTYEMNLRAKPEELLDWDKPMTAQPGVTAKINDELERRIVRNHPDWRTYSVMQDDLATTTGEEAYKLLASKDVANMGQLGASTFLRDLDIPGIRYLDEGSRRPVQLHLTDLDRPETLDFRSLPDAQAWLTKAGKTADSPGVRLVESPQTHNYVGTDPSKLDILAKYGVAGAAAVPPTLGAFTAQDQYEAR